MSSLEGKILNFEKIDDLFFCIEVLAQVKSLIHEQSPDLAGKIDLITNSVMTQSEELMEGFTNVTGKKTVRVEQNDIIDIFTGEVVYKCQ